MKCHAVTNGKAIFINALMVSSLHVGERNVSEVCGWFVTGVFKRRFVLGCDQLRFLADVCRLFEQDRRFDRLLRLVRLSCFERLRERRRLLCLRSFSCLFLCMRNSDRLCDLVR